MSFRDKFATKEQYNEYFRIYRQSDKWKKYHMEHIRQWRKKHGTTKDSIRRKVDRAVRNGTIVKIPCKCGRTDVQAHHPDYRSPLRIIWVCPPCHAVLDRAEGRRYK